MENERVDRRVQRTRQLLKDALVSLLVEKPYDTITIQNIIDRANVGRSTFYAHYQDKEVLLLSSIEEVVHSLIWGVQESAGGAAGHGESSPILSTEPIFRHAQEQHRLHKAMVAGRGIDVITSTIQTHLSRHIRERIEQRLPEGQSLSVPPPVMATHLAGALMTLLIWWLEHDMPYSPERMDDMFQALTMPGVAAALGITV